MKRALLIFAASLAVLLATASPASAHTVSISHGPNWGKVLAEHRTIVVHDGECNGSDDVARVDFQRTGYSGYLSVWDSNGCSVGDKTYTLPTGTVTKFRLCESQNGGYASTDWCSPPADGGSDDWIYV